MPASFELHDRPDIESPVLVMALEGWIDAGYGGANAMSTLLAELDTQPVATFDADELLDHRARRPILHLVEGVNKELSWPGIELRAATDLAGNHLLLLAGAEPDHGWRAFSIAVTDLALGFGARMVLGLGAYPAATPHTRRTVLSCTAASEELVAAWPFLRGTLDVPAGVQAAIEARAAEAGLPSMGIWAQVPHYAAAMAYPGASLALIEGLMKVGDLTLPKGDLASDAQDARDRLDAIISNNVEHSEMVRALETETDANADDAPLPSGDELAAELERFLREQGKGDH